MMFLRKVLAYSLLALTALLSAEVFSYDVIKEPSADGKRVYETVPGDPFGFRCFTLKNGMRAVLARNTRKPRIQTYIGVCAGSVQDPAESTGLAHYFEHMMFKGSAKIASLNWEKEKPLLDRIEALFEQYRMEKDPAKRKAIYAEIDRVSGEAAAYSNDEYWSLVRNMGALGTNAYTSDEVTCYESDIPANMLERFLTLERERFSNVALRRFHTELETVYEEFNRGQDNDVRRAVQTLCRQLYPTHPLGRPVIGLPEHLKNPSVRDVAHFFTQYYVPENMIVILAGDLEYDSAAEILERTLGTLPRGTAPRPADPPRDPEITADRTMEIFGEQAECVFVAYRYPRNAKTEYLTDLMFSALQNGNCGLLDRDLILPQAVQAAQCFSLSNTLDHVLCLYGMPKPGQSLDDVQKLLLAEVEKLKHGEFSDTVITAAANNDRLSLIKKAEKHTDMADAAKSVFLEQRGITMANVLNDMDAADRTTRAQIAAFAAKNLKHSVTVFKRSGKNKDAVHAEKPPITPVQISSAPSAYAAEIVRVPAGAAPQVQTVDFEKALTVTEFGPGKKLYSVKNPVNDRFVLSIEFPRGCYNSQLRPIIFQLAELTGTQNHSVTEWNEMLYAQALTMDYRMNMFDSAISISGLQRDLPKAIALLKEKLTHSSSDARAYRNLVERIRKARENSRKTPGNLLSAAVSYALYGKHNPTIDTEIPTEKLEKMKPEELTQSFNDLLRTEHFNLVYYGPDKPENVAKLCKAAFDVKLTSGMEPAPLHFQIVPPQDNMVYVVKNPAMTQILVALIRPDEIAIPGNSSFAKLYSRYGGQLYFSELREKQSLGYMAYSCYTIPSISPDNYSLFQAVLGTQPDKLQMGMDSILKLSDGMPLDEPLFEASKNNVLNQLRTARSLPENYYASMIYYQRMKIPFDRNQRDFDKISAVSGSNFRTMVQQHISGRKNVWVLVGNVDAAKINLSKFGTVKYLALDDILMK